MTTVIVAVDGSDACDRAAAAAARLFADCDLIVASVVPPWPDPATSDSAGVRHACQRIALDVAKSATARARDAVGGAGRIEILEGEPIEMLTALVVTEDADVLVLGRIRSGPVRSLLGSSIGSELARIAPCTVLALGEDEELHAATS